MHPSVDVSVTEVLDEHVTEQVNVARSAHSVYRQVITETCHVLVSAAATAHRTGLYT